jgi:hypothetical protein
LLCGSPKFLLYPAGKSTSGDLIILASISGQFNPQWQKVVIIDVMARSMALPCIDSRQETQYPVLCHRYASAHHCTIKYLSKGGILAKTNFQYEKRQKELEKKRKKEEKLKRKLERDSVPEDNPEQPVPQDGEVRNETP